MRSSLGPVLLLSIAAVAAADSVMFDENGVSFCDDGATYAVIQRKNGVQRVRVYRTPDDTPIDWHARRRIESDYTPADGHVQVGDVDFRGYGGQTLLARAGRTVVRVREYLEPRRPDERAAVIQVRSTDGDVEADVLLSELMDENVRRQLPRSISFVHWFDRAWIDEGSGHCVVLAGGERAWAVDLCDGTLSDVTGAQLVAGIRRENTGDALHALYTLTQYALTLGTQATRERLVALARDAELGAFVKSQVVAELAARDCADDELLASLHAGPVYAGALRVLTRPVAVRRPFPYSNERRLGALRLLGAGKRSKEDLYALVLAAEDEDDEFAAAAVAALTRRECTKNRRSLRRLLMQQPRHSRALGEYYSRYRDLRATLLLVSGLESAVEREDDDAADALVAALRKQTGIDAGRDIAGWRRWLER